MKMRSLTLIALTALAAVGAACGATSNGGSGTPTATTPPTSPTPGASIHDIQSGVIASNSTVTLSGIIVTGVKPGGSGYDFWAQDVGGGQYSGIYFFDKNAKTDPSIAIGDVVTVTGTFQEYYQAGSSFSLSEIIPSSMTIDNSGMTPTADDVTSAELKNTVAEPWEGCLVNVTDATVTTVGLGFGEYGVGATGTTDKVHVDHAMFDSFEPRLVGETMTKLEGVVDYGFKNFHIDPRTAADVTGNGTNTPVAKTLNQVLTDTSIKAGQLLTVTNVVVSGLSPYTNASSQQKVSFWAQDATTGAANTGMYFNDVFYKNPATLQVGSKVTLTGKLLVFGTTTLSHEIDFGYQDGGTVTVDNAGAVAPTPMVVSVTNLHGANAAQYEGLLVQANSTQDPGLKVTAAPNSFNEYTVGTAADPGVWVGVLGPPAGDTHGGKTANLAIAKAQGPVYYNFGHYYLEPQAATDVQ